MLAEQSVVCPILIGRDAPLSTVFHTLDRARGGLGSTLLVSGEAGVGKSRLVRAMVERARTTGFATLQGACFEADRSQPYAPVLDLVRTLSATASPALAGHYFEPAGAELVTLFPELRSIFPDAAPRPVLDPEESRRQLFHSLSEAIHALGRIQPLLLVIEDVHWSDDATLDLMLHLSRRIAAQSIAVILTFRSDEVGPRLARLLADLDRARCASEVSLRPLGAADVSAMLQAIFGAQMTLGTAFVDGLHGLTEGNPFFVEEMLKALLVAGDLERSDGAWRARPLEHVRVPRTATEAVGRRLAGLSEAARAVASVAAVAGRRFDFALLQALTRHEDAALLALVKELVDAQLVVEESADRFAFRHALTREAIKARLLTRERVAMHRAIAAALEERRGERSNDADDALAYHTFEAGMWASARHHALRAAAHASALSAPREALQQLERAVVATVNAGEQPDGVLLIARGRAHETLGAFPLANDDFIAALTAARASGAPRDAWVALHALGMLWAARDYERAGRYRTEALEVARTIGDPTLLARSLNRVGNWHVNREDPHSGIPYHDEALAIFEQAGDERGVAETVDLLAMAHHIAGAQSAAFELYERSVDLFTALGDRRGLANALSLMTACGPSYHASAGPVRASARGTELMSDERAVRLCGEIGWRAGEAFSRYLLADCLAWRGEYARALRLARESLTIAEEIEHLEWQCGAHRVLGTVSLAMCAPLLAVPQLQAAHDIARRLSSTIWIRWTAAPLAIALARAGDVRRAVAVLDAVDSDVGAPIAVRTTFSGVNSTLGSRSLALARAEAALAADAPEDALASIADRDAAGVPRIALLRGQAFSRLERWDDAANAIAAARAGAEEQGARPLLLRIEGAQGSLHLAARQRLEARRSFDLARSIAESLVSDLDEPLLVPAFRAGVDLLAPAPPARTAAQAAKAAHGGLTRRERDTAALIAQGKSNRAIARQLGIGERTVEGHVASALAKLDFSSRSQIAVWAAEQGLVGSEPGVSRPRH